MPKTVITLPCTAQDLESALHAVCDHHGLWNGRIDTMCDGSDSGDACVSIVLSEGSGESSPSPSAPTSPAPANSAALREALEKAKKAICHHAKYVCQSLSWENSDIQSNCGDVLCVRRDLCEAKTAINAALAKPPRNCDMFGGDYKMLHTAWFDWTGSPSGQNPDGTAKMVFGEWLLAPAIKKGGAK